MSRLVFAGVAVVYAVGRIGQVHANESLTDLFNGSDLNGWHATIGNLRADSDSGPRPRAEQVFSVVEIDGEPAIRISGEAYGGLATVESFGNYHLELEFKWGEKRYWPRADKPFDSGLLYHGQESSWDRTGWLESLEFGLLEGGETSDFWSVPGAYGSRMMADMEGEEIPLELRRYESQPYRYKPGGERVIVGPKTAALNSYDNDKPHDHWNKLELFCIDNTAIHVVNGEVNLVLSNIRRLIDGHEEPIDHGRIQFQSEGAEVYFRRIRLKNTSEIPMAYVEQMIRPPHNELTNAEESAGWKQLFDGETTQGWRGYRMSKTPLGWKVIDGALVSVGEGGEDLVIEETFGDFELKLEFKVARGANSGIFYRVTEDADAIYKSGIEYEIRDQAAWLDDAWKTAAVYGMYDYDGSASNPVGYWNRARIVIRDNHVEHWLNGVKVADYELRSSDWNERKNKKFGSFPDYGTANKGHIVLQNHNSHVWFRNMKIKHIENK